MNTELAAVLITAAVSISGSWLIARQSGKTGARDATTHEREAAIRERNVDLTRIKNLEDRDAMWEQRCNTLWKARETDAIIKRTQGDHIDILEDHIWRKQPPPPPQRPALT